MRQIRKFWGCEWPSVQQDATQGERWNYATKTCGSQNFVTRNCASKNYETKNYVTRNRETKNCATRNAESTSETHSPNGATTTENRVLAYLACSTPPRASATHHCRLQASELVQRRLGRDCDIFVDLADVGSDLRGDGGGNLHHADIHARHHAELVRTSDEVSR